LKNKGQLPGWSKQDKFTAKEQILDFHYPSSISFNHLLKKGGSSIYHYELTGASKTSP